MTRSCYLDEVSDARRAPEDDPLVHGDRLVALLLLDRDVSSKEQQRERRHLGAVVQEDLRTRRCRRLGARQTVKLCYLRTTQAALLWRRLSVPLVTRVVRVTVPWKPVPLHFRLPRSYRQPFINFSY